MGAHKSLLLWSSECSCNIFSSQKYITSRSPELIKFNLERQIIHNLFQIMISVNHKRGFYEEDMSDALFVNIIVEWNQSGSKSVPNVMFEKVWFKKSNGQMQGITLSEKLWKKLLVLLQDLASRRKFFFKIDLVNPTRWSNTLIQFELFECVWPFCGVGG